MKKIKSYIDNNLLLKIASFNSLAIGVRILSGLLTSKAIAVFVGAEGLALIGNLRNFLTTIYAFTTFGFTNGIVKYVAEFKDQTAKLSPLISTLLISLLTATILISTVCYFNAQTINAYIFNETNDYTYLIKFLAITLPFHAVNVFMISVLNGLSKHKLYIRINIAAQILGLLVTLFLIWQNNIEGALLAIILVPIILFAVLFLGFFEFQQFFKSVRWQKMDKGILKNISSYSVMALFSAVALPLVTWAIRNYLIDSIGQKEAGFWEAMLRISSYYLMFISTLLTLYLLPKLSEITTDKGFRNEIFNFYKQIIPIFGLGLIILYFLREFIIKIIFSADFEPVSTLFFWQLLGDFIKVLALVISYQFLAKKMMWYYLITEVLSVIVLYFSSIYFIDNYGLHGVTVAHFVTYVIYLMMMIIVFRKIVFGTFTNDDLHAKE